MDSTHNPQQFQAPFQAPLAGTSEGNAGGTATLTIPETLPERCQELYRLAEKLYQRDPDWVSFFREVLGVGGVARRFFPTAEALAEFEASTEYEAIQQMVAQLRQQSGSAGGNGNVESREPTRVITVRLPKCLHESLKTEAHERHTSMNKLCISKLLQVIDGQFVPSE